MINVQEQSVPLVHPKDMTCLYIHIPFCLKKCNYCSFASSVHSPKFQTKYLTALQLELELIAKSYGAGRLRTLFFGGGTPTCLDRHKLVSIIELCKDLFGLEKEAEISVEANPGTVDELYLELLLNSGVNRLSIGVQSLVESELRAIGRLHNRSQAIKAYLMSQKVGFTNINLDLMYGLPGQDTKSWLMSLQKALDLSPQHLSLYQLMVEEGTHFGHLEEKGQLNLPREDEILEIDAVTADICRKKQYIQYETSNFALKGYECRHNINYWENRDYMAAGAAAVSYVAGVREKRISEPKDYAENLLNGGTAISERECLDKEASFRETVIMGLRMKRGVNIEGLKLRYDLTPIKYYGKTLSKFLKTEMMELTEGQLKITEKGWPLSNQIMAELV